MTTTTTTAKTGPLTASGVAPLPFTFQALSAAEIEVTRNGVVASPSTYTVTLNGDSTGSITPTTSWGSDPVYIYSAPSYQQPANFTRFSQLFPDAFNEPFDRLARTVLGLKDFVDRNVVALQTTVAGLQANAGDAVRSSMVAGYSAMKDLLQNMRRTADSYRTRLGKFSDVFSTSTGINAGASLHYDYDARKVVGTQRSFANTVAPEEDFESIADWTTNVGVTVIDPGDPDPMVGKVAELNTGATPGNTAVLRKYFGVIPATFGVSVLMGMATDNGSASTALEFQAQNSNGHLLKQRVYSNAVQFFYNGAWNTQFPYGGSTATLTEWWYNAVYNGGSSYTVRLFAGTQELPGFTGNLPGGTPGENGWVGFIQYSGATANVRGRAAFLQIGTSALPADMNLVSVATDVVTEPNEISMGVMFEDVCAQTVINTDLKGWVTKNGGADWTQVVLTNYGQIDNGVLDPNKPVYFLAGSATLPPSGTHSVAMRLTSANGRYYSVNGWGYEVVA